MARARTDRTSALAFDAITVEGALISSAMLARIAQHKADEQTDADYGVPKGLTLRDEIARYFRIGQAMFKELTATEKPSTAATVNFIEKLLRDVFGFSDIRRVGQHTVGDRQFTITLEGLGGRVPVVVVPPADDLDRPSTHLTTDGRRRSAASALQDWLNAGEGALWGLCANGVQLRLVRDNASLTRPAYVDADLRRIFESDAFADFAALWLLVHASRFGLAGTPPSDSALERWRDAGQKEGVTARDKLRDGVEAALLSLGNGFLSHSNNTALREKLHANRNTVTIPTTAHIFDALAGRTVYGPLVGRAQDLSGGASALHWPLEFPDVMAVGGFDVVLGNPPWERIKLQEQEFFASRDPEIAEAPNAAARGRLIAKLKTPSPVPESAIYMRNSKRRSDPLKPHRSSPALMEKKTGAFRSRDAAMSTLTRCLLSYLRTSLARADAQA
jgi:hypothetical protein